MLLPLVGLLFGVLAGFLLNVNVGFELQRYSAVAILAALDSVLGAVRAGISRIIVPKDNEPDLEDLPQEVRDKIEVHLVSELGEVLALTLRGATFREGRLLFGDEKNPRDVMPLSAGFRH